MWQLSHGSARPPLALVTLLGWTQPAHPPSPWLLQHLLVAWSRSQERCVTTPPNWEGTLVTSSFEL